jgi:hypothetical protein
MTTPLRQAYAATSRESPNAIVRLGRSWLGRVLRLGQPHGLHPRPRWPRPRHWRCWRPCSARLLVSVVPLVGAVAHCESVGTRVFNALLGLFGCLSGSTRSA